MPVTNIMSGMFKARIGQCLQEIFEHYRSVAPGQVLEKMWNLIQGAVNNDKDLVYSLSSTYEKHVYTILRRIMDAEYRVLKHYEIINNKRDTIRLHLKDYTLAFQEELQDLARKNLRRALLRSNQFQDLTCRYDAAFSSRQVPQLV